jgi:hypothetical protein
VRIAFVYAEEAVAIFLVVASPGFTILLVAATADPG